MKQAGQTRSFFSSRLFVVIAILTAPFLIALSLGLTTGERVLTALFPSMSEEARRHFKNDPMLATFLPTILPDGAFGAVQTLKSLGFAPDERTRDVARPEVVVVRPSATFESVTTPSEKLVIVVPGIGGIAKHSLNEVFTKPFVELGYTALILPNPVSVSFALHRLPAADRFRYSVSVESLCEAIRETLDDQISQIDRTKLKSVALAGYSLGARYSLSLRSCLRKLVPQVSVQVLAVNPPIDFNYAVQTLDSFAGTAREKSFRLYRAGFRVMWAKALATSSEKLLDSPRLSELIYILSPDVEILPELRASSFLLGLERVQDGDLGRSYQLLPSANARFASFLEVSGESNQPLIEELKSVPRAFRKESVSLLLTLDDFLVRERDVHELEKVRGVTNLNVSVYPHGGHVGILFEPEFTDFVATHLRRDEVSTEK